eukprot:4251012-Lingulodinium_polyedra.AAC.1
MQQTYKASFLGKGVVSKETAFVIATQWAYCMQYLFDFSREEPEATPARRRVHLDQFVESQDFRVVATSEDPLIKDHVRRVRALMQV